MDENRTRRTVIAIIVVIIIILIIVLIFTYMGGKSHMTQVLTSSVTDCPAVTPPTNVTITQIDNQTITITWQSVNNVPRYKAFVGIATGFADTAAIATQISDTNQAIISNLVTGYTYYAYVESLNQCNVPSVKSNEASKFLSFPAQFKIANRSSPFYVMANDGTNVDLEPDCQGVSNLCLYTYNTNNSFIQSVADPTMCIVSFPDFPNPNRLELKVCNSIESSSDPTIGQWQYNQAQGAFCHYPASTTGTGMNTDPNVATTACAVVSGSFASGTPIRIGGYSSSPQDIWDVLAV
jgi:hypothetical protein